jgi:hypothetical protein
VLENTVCPDVGEIELVAVMPLLAENEAAVALAGVLECRWARKPASTPIVAASTSTAAVSPTTRARRPPRGDCFLGRAGWNDGVATYGAKG